MKSLLPVLALTFLAGTVASAEEIPVISLDAAGASVVKTVPAGQYLEGLQNVLSAVNSATRSRLDAQASAQRCDPRASWNLKAIAVGIGAQVSAGLGPLIGVSAKAAMRMVYSRHEGQKAKVFHAKS